MKENKFYNPYATFEYKVDAPKKPNQKPASTVRGGTGDLRAKGGKK